MHRTDSILKQRRTAGELAQYCCAMTGFAFQLAWMVEDISVVIFGERDCVNAFPRLLPFGSRDEWTIYSATLREEDVIAGRAEERLYECLRAVAERGRPIIVLSTCLTEMIAADPGPVCAQIESETGVRVVPVRTSGLTPRTQAEVMDWFARVLWDSFGAHGKPEPNAVNFVGYQTNVAPEPWLQSISFREELSAILSRLGLRLNATVPAGARLHDWTVLPLGGLTVMADRALYPTLARLLSGGERTLIEVSPPKGLAQTDAFYSTLARYAGVSLSAFLNSVPERLAAVEAIKIGRAHFSGMRLAYGLGSHHNFDASQLNFEGLADLPLLLELGFDVILVIQERDRPEVHERIKRNLEAMQVNLPYRLFYEPAVLAPVLRECQVQVAYLSDFLSDQAERAEVPMVRLGRLRPSYRGVCDAVSVFLRAFARGFEGRYRRYLGL